MRQACGSILEEWGKFPEILHFDLKVFSVNVENSFGFTNKLGLLWLNTILYEPMNNTKTENSLGNEITKNVIIVLKTIKKL